MRQLDVIVASGLPFSRPVFIGASAEKDLIISGCDSTIEPIRRFLDGLNVGDGVTIKEVYRVSRLLGKRRSGQMDVAQLIHISSEKNVELIKKIKKKEQVVVPLPLDGLECRLAEYCFRYINADFLKKKADMYIQELDSCEQAVQKKPEMYKDEEGFIYPTRKTAIQAVSGVESRLVSSGINERENRFLISVDLNSTRTKKKKRKGGHEVDFYRFQIRQQKEQEYLRMKSQKEAELSALDELRRSKKLKLCLNSP